MIGIFRKKASVISLVTVDIGQRSIQIPLARIQGKSKGPILLVTAGNDGDEYAGIAAGYTIIDLFAHQDFSGELIVIPIVNIPGFEQETSINPLDGKFPKHIYPGRVEGTSTERMRYWLRGYVQKADLWMDLHSGSLTEKVYPYIHAWKTSYAPVDDTLVKLLHCLDVPHIVFQTTTGDIHSPGTDDCGYLMCESGSFGSYDISAISRHVDWVTTAMTHLHMIPGDTTSIKKTILSKVREYTVSRDGVWFPIVYPSGKINHGEALGEVRSLDGTVSETVICKESGVFLWAKEGLRARAGDSVAGIGH